MGQDKLVTVFGGSGFVGRHVVRTLTKRGYRVRVAVRRPDLAGHTQPLGHLGQVQPVQANLRHPWSIERALKGADAAVNLVGLLHNSGKQTFDAIHDEGAGAVAEACKKEAIETLVHMSAIGADTSSVSAYARTKAAGEAAVQAVKPDTVIVRPSIIFGPEDGFFNLFAGLARLTPVLPLIGGETLFQPIYVGDVAEVIARGVDDRLKPGATYELGGPEIKSFKALMEDMLEVTERKRVLAPVPAPFAMFKAAFLQLLPKPLLTIDQVRLLQIDNVVGEEARIAGHTLEGLGLSGHTLAAILPTYLWSYRATGQFRNPATH